MTLPPRALPLLALLAAAGCAADDYARWADRRVAALVRDRQERTLDYVTPLEVTTPTEAAARPARKSYQLVPLTRLPADLPEDGALGVDDVGPRPVGAGLPYEPLGPDAPNAATPLVEPAGNNLTSDVDAARQAALGALRLGPLDDVPRTATLALFESVAYGVAHSRDYRDEAEGLYLAALDVTLERHLLSPRPFASLSANFDGDQASPDYSAALNVVGRAGVRQRLPYGGELVATALAGFVQGLQGNVADGETAELALRGTVPLLRDAGPIALEGLIGAERELVYATRGFEVYRRQYAVEVAQRYFNLLTAQQSLRNRYLRYQSLGDLTARTRALFAAGRITKLEVQRSEQELLTAEDDVNAALERLENQLDNFKIFLGMPVTTPLRVVPVRVALDLPPELDAQAVAPTGADDAAPARDGAEPAVGAARRYRLELQTARDRVDDARRAVANASNQLAPDLTLEGGVALGNETGTPARQLDSDALTYDAGLTLDLPLDRVAERNRYRAALVALERSARQVRDVEEQVAAEVRASLRSIRSARATLALQARGIEVARRRLEFANESLATGRTTDSRNVVEAQNSLLQAQDRFDQAQNNLQVQILTTLSRTGLLRVDPRAGTLGLAMAGGPDRRVAVPVDAINTDDVVQEPEPAVR